MPSTAMPLEGEGAPPSPWAETDEVFKARAIEEGNWPAFLTDRAAYRFRGAPRMWAHRFAQQHYPPPDFPVKSIRTNRSPSECGLGGHGVTEAKMRAKVIDQLGIEGSARASEFEGRTCSVSAAMQWVAENLGIKIVRQDAPSKLAWSVYRWASSHPTKETKFYELYLGRRYKPEKDDDDDFDPAEGLNIGGEDVGLPRQFAVPDVLPADPDRPGREQAVEDGDELASFTVGERSEADS